MHHYCPVCGEKSDFKFLPREWDQYQRTLMVCTHCNHKQAKPGQTKVDWRIGLSEEMRAMEEQHRHDSAKLLVARAIEGIYPRPDTPDYDLTTPRHGRVRVKARSRGLKHLNWVHVHDVHLGGFDYLVLVEFDAAGFVAGAGGLSRAQVAEFAHSVVLAAGGGQVTKLAARGRWKQRADRIVLPAWAA